MCRCQYRCFLRAYDLTGQRLPRHPRLEQWTRPAVVCVELVSKVELDWRAVLMKGEKSLSLDLIGVGDEAKMGVPVGVLMVDLLLLPQHGGVLPFSQVRSAVKGCAGCVGIGGNAHSTASTVVQGRVMGCLRVRFVVFSSA